MANTTYLDLLAKYGVGSAHPGGLPLTRELLKSLPIDRNTRILDAGCGTGETAAYIAKTYGCKITAVDINDAMIRKASERFKRENLNIELKRADVMNLPFKPESFDIVLSESVASFTTIKKTLKEFARVLKKGGTLMAIEMTAESSLNERDFMNIKSVYSIDRVLTEGEWIDALYKSDFITVKAHNVRIRPTFKVTSYQMMMDFAPHLKTINYYNSLLRYRVYLCTP